MPLFTRGQRCGPGIVRASPPCDLAMPKHRVLFCVAALVLSGPALAACNGTWARPSAETLQISDGTDFRITRYASLEAGLALVQDGRRVEVLFTRAGYLIKGVPDAELPKFAQSAHWLTMLSFPATSAVWDAVKTPPCSANGIYAVAQAVLREGASRVGGLLLRRATGEAVADGKGEIRYSIRFDTEPALAPERALTYVGTLSFQSPGEAMPDGTDVGGFSVVRPGQPSVTLEPGTTLAQLRARLTPDR